MRSLIWTMLLTAFLVAVSPSLLAFEGKTNGEFFAGYSHKIYDSSQTIDNALFFGAIGTTSLTKNWSFSYIMNTQNDEYIELNTMAFVWDDVVDYGPFKADTTISIGDIMVPMGLYELQRLYPTPDTPPSLNDSFVNETYIDAAHSHEYGMKIELDKGNYNFAAQVYVPRQKRVPLEKNAGFYVRHLQDLGFQSMSNREKQLSVNLLNRSNPDHMEETGQYTFMAVTYDNRRDTLVDAELFIHRRDMTFGGETSMVRSTTARIGVERRVAERVFVIGEAMRRVAVGKIPDKMQAYSASLLWDKSPFIPYAGATYANSSHFEIMEFNAGATYVFTQHLDIKLNFRAVDGKYEPLAAIFSDAMNSCDQNCQAAWDTIIPFNPAAADLKQKGRQIEINKKGLELTATFRF